MNHLPSKTALGAALLSLCSVPASAQIMDLDTAVREKLNLSTYSTQALEIPALEEEGVAFEVEIDGQPMTMMLERFSLRAPDFRLLVSDGTGAPRQVAAPEPRTVRGMILELDGSRVTGSLVDGQLNAEIIYGDQHWGLQPLTAAVPTAAPNQHLVYNASLVEPASGVCGVDASHLTPTTTGSTHALGSGQRMCELAIECDPGYYNGNGANLASTLNDVELIYNRVDNIYDSDVDTRFIITTVHVWTANSPYSGDLGNRLSQFRSLWNSSFGFVKKDLAHYMVGGTQGGTIGVAYIAGVCNSNRYGVSRTKFSNNLVQRTALTAHEIGHNYNSGHCSGSTCTIMCAGIGGCGGPLTHFGPSASNTIRNYSFSRACTPQNGDHLTVPWSDNFESNSINTDNWPASQGATTSTAATNETSGTRSLNLDGGNGSDEGQDRIISNYILLGGESGYFVSYNTQHKGVAIGGSLLVEYRQSNGSWEPLDTVSSNGVDQNSFEAHTHPVPGNGYHDEFQIRFTSQNGAGTGSDWYIDDVAVSEDAGCSGASNYCFTSPNSVGAGMTLTATGSTSHTANDLGFFALGGPAGNFGVLFMGPDQTTAIFGNGVLCVAGGILRYDPIQIDGLGVASLTVDYAVPPAAVNMLPGTIWNFQFWYRDPAGGGPGFNTTDAVRVEVCD